MAKSVLKNLAIFTGKYLCLSLFLIKNFKATLIKRDSNTIKILYRVQTQVIFCKYCGIFLINCLEEHLRPAASIRSYFDTINLKQTGFFTTYYPIILKFLFGSKNIKINSEIVNLKTKKQKKNNVDVYVCVCYVCMLCKSENLCFLNLYSVHAERILGLSQC